MILILSLNIRPHEINAHVNVNRDTPSEGGMNILESVRDFGTHANDESQNNSQSRANDSTSNSQNAHLISEQSFTLSAYPSRTQDTVPDEVKNPVDDCEGQEDGGDVVEQHKQCMFDETGGFAGRDGQVGLEDCLHCWIHR
jgi:hypothetical protein